MRIQELARYVADEVEVRTGVRLTVDIGAHRETAFYWNGRRRWNMSIEYECHSIQDYREYDKCLSVDGSRLSLDGAIDWISQLAWAGWPEPQTHASVPLDDLYLLIAAAPESVRKRLSERYEWAMAPEAFSAMPEPLED